MPTRTATPLILTAMPDRNAFARFEHLRQTHFPPERNFVAAHITLFHHLPGTKVAEIERRLKSETRSMPAFEARVAGFRNLGRGTALRIQSPALLDVRAALADAFAFWLIPQDRQVFTPHVTIQNKVEPCSAKALIDSLTPAFLPWTFRIEGLTLWRYLGGPWQKLRDFRFR